MKLISCRTDSSSHSQVFHSEHLTLWPVFENPHGKEMPDPGPQIYPVEFNYPSSLYIKIRFTAIRLDESLTVRLNVTKANAKATVVS